MIKQKLTKLYVLIAAVILIASAMSMTALAAPDQSPENIPTLYVKDYLVQAGDAVEVEICIENNPGISNATLTLSFDEGLTLLSVQQGDALNMLDFTAPEGVGEGAPATSYNFVWNSLDQADSSNGTILLLTFAIPSDADPETIYSLDLSYEFGNIADGDENPIDIDIFDGQIEILNYLPGDVDGNGEINADDVTALRQYIVGGYDVEINVKAGDVDDNGRLNGSDVALIRQYVAQGYGVTLKPSTKCLNHTLTKVDAVPATCTTDGNIEYWQCENCNKYYFNEDKEITLEEATIDALGHSWTFPAAECSVCHEAAPAGLYSATGEQLALWADLGINIGTNYTTADTSSENYVAETDYTLNSESGYSVLMKGEYQDQTGLIIVLPEVEAIGNSAFRDCSNVALVIFPDCLTTIGEQVFRSTSITEVIFGENSQLTTVGASAFYTCESITTIKMPATLTSVGNNAFNGCKALTDLTLGHWPTTFGNYVLSGCTAGSINLTVESGAITNKLKGLAALKSLTIGGDVTSIAYQSFYQCANLESVTIKAGDGALEIGAQAIVENAKLTTITIEDREGTITILGNAFRKNYALTTVVIGRGVTNIGGSAFLDCTALNSITYTGTVEEWNAITKGTDWHKNVPAKNVTCSDGVVCFHFNTTVLEGYDATCTTDGLTDGVHCNDCNVDIVPRETIDALGHNEIPHEGKDASCTEAGWKAYVTCSRCDYTTYEKIDALDHNYVDNVCTRCGEMDHDCNTDATEVKPEYLAVEATCTTLAQYYKQCSVCGRVSDTETFEAGEYAPHTWTFPAAECSVCHEAAPAGMYVPADNGAYDFKTFEELGISIDTNYTTENWESEGGYSVLMGDAYKDKTGIVLVLPEVEAVGERIFRGCTNISLVIFPDSIVTVGSHAFRETGITSITFGENSQLDTIGQSAFYQCTSLTSVKLPASLNSIGATAINGSENLTTVVMGKWPATIGSNVFNSCGTGTIDMTIESGAITNALKGRAAIKSLTIGGDVESIAYQAFYKCANLESVTIKAGDGALEIGAQAITENAKLTTITIEDREGTITIIGNAFRKNYALTTVVIGRGVTNISSNTFLDCTALENISYTGTVAEWNAITKGSGWNTNVPAQYVTCSDGNGCIHIIVVDAAVAPDCVNTGLTEGSHCSRCNAVLVEQTVVNALGHTLVEIEAKVDATCTTDGKTAVMDCEVCDHVEGGVTIPANGHTEVTVPGQAATCTENGYTESKYCEVCEKVLLEQTPIIAIGHVYLNDDDESCENCSYIREVGCKHTNTVPIPAKAATCTDTGLTEGLQCADCEVVITDQTVTNALGHAEVPHEAQAPTCTAIGWDAYVTCSRCSYTTYVEIPATDHAYADEFTVDVTATCTTAGSKSKHCASCDSKTEVTVIDALGHSWAFPAAECSVCHEAAPAGLYSATGEQLALWADLGINIGTNYTTADTSSENYVAETDYTLNSESGYSVLMKGEYQDQTGLIVVLPEVEAIGNSAFRDCSNVALVIFPDSLTTIGDQVFRSTSITEVIFGENSQLTTVGASAFYTCESITTIKMPATLTSVGNNAFNGCKALTDLTLGHWPTTFGNYVLSGCTAGSINLTVESGDITNKLKGLAALKSLTIGGDVTSIAYQSFYQCANIESVTIKSGDGALEIGAQAIVENAKLTTITIEDREGTITILGNAFRRNRALTTVVIGRGVTNIGGSAFLDCTALNSITYTGTVEEWNAITKGADWNKGIATCEVTCSDETVYVHRYTSAVTDPTCTDKGYTTHTCEICEHSYTDTEVDAVGHIPGDEATCITAQTCTVCRDTIVGALGHTEVIDEAQAPSCTETGLTEGKHCSVCSAIIVEQVTVPANGHTNDGAGNCSVCGDPIAHDHVYDKEIVADKYLASTATCTEYATYYKSCYCGVSDAEVSETFEYVEGGYTAHTWSFPAAACSECPAQAPEGIYVPANSGAYEFSTSFEALSFDVTADYTADNYATDAAYSILMNGTYPESGVIVVLPEVEKIGARSFRNCTNVSLVIFPDSIKTIGTHAFREMGITSVTFGENSQLETIDASAFYKNASLTTVTLPVSLTTIGNYTFAETGITSLTFGKLPSSWGTNVFQSVKQYSINVVIKGGTVTATNNSALKAFANSITIGSGVASIGTEAFKGWTSLKKVTIAVSNTGWKAFSGCTGINKVTFEEGVTHIKAQMFTGCTGLTEIVLPTTLGAIDSGVFNNCAALETIRFNGNKADWNDALNTKLNVSELATTILCADGERCLHIIVVDAAVDPDCENTGLTEGSHCSRCDEVLVEQIVLDALGHNCTNPPCTAPQICSVCQEMISDITGHAWNEDSICDNCGALATACALNGHTWGTPATAGSQCTVCQLIATECDVAGNHEWIVDSNTGLTICSREGCKAVQGSDIPADKNLALGLSGIPVATPDMTQDELRDIVVDFMKLQLSFAYRVDLGTDSENVPRTVYSYYIKNLISSYNDAFLNLDSLKDPENTKHTVYDNQYYGGIPYIGNASGNIYRWLPFYDMATGTMDWTPIINTSRNELWTGYMGGDKAYNISSAVFGNSCATSCFWAWSRVTNKLKSAWSSTWTIDNGYVPVGNYVLPEVVNGEYANVNYVGSNSETTMYEAYAEMLRADCLIQNGHAVMAIGDPVIYYINDDESQGIDGTRSYILIAEQVGAFLNKAPHNGGIPLSSPLNSNGTSYLVMCNYPGIIKNIGNNGAMQIKPMEWKFEYLYNEGYIPFTIPELARDENKVELQEVTFNSKASELMSLTSITVSEISSYTSIISNYYISHANFIVSDSEGEEVFSAIYAKSDESIKITEGTTVNLQHISLKEALNNNGIYGNTTYIKDNLNANAGKGYTLTIQLVLSTGETVDIFSGTLN